MENEIARMTDKQVREAILKMAKFAEKGIGCLSTATDYSRGYRNGIAQSQDIIRSIIKTA